MTEQERILKIQHDAMVNRYIAEKNKGNLDYVAMMTDVELPEDEDTMEGAMIDE